MASKVLLSPSEVKLKKAFREEALTSALCEEKGADVLIYSDNGLLGLQRKHVPGDFISSMTTDGRFAKSLPLLAAGCTFSRVVCEGVFKYWPDGSLFLGMTKDGKRIPSHYDRDHIHGMLNDIEFMYGIQIRYTESIDDTVRYIRSLQRFLDAKKHVGLFTRPKAQGKWGVPTTKDIRLWLLQSFQGIGVQTANKIINHFGDAPIRWTCTPQELANVCHVQIKYAEEWINCLTRNVSITYENASNVSGEHSLDDLRQLLRKG